MSFDPQTGLPVQPPRSGGCFKSCLTIGCLGSIVLAICCGGGAMLFSRSMQIQDDPQIATLVGQEIAKGALLDDFEAQSSVKIEIPFVGPFLKMAFYRSDDQAMLVLGELNEQFSSGVGAEAFEGQFGEELDRRTNRQSFQIEQREHRKLMVRGESSDFTFAQAVGARGERQGKKVWIVSGSFQGKTGAGYLLLIAPLEQYTADELAAQIQSIQ